LSKRTRKASRGAEERVGLFEVDTTAYLYEFTAFLKGIDGRSPAILHGPSALTAATIDGCRQLSNIAALIER
jgi:hypothetical protein